MTEDRDEDREEGRGFRVTDRRRFSDAGAAKADASAAPDQAGATQAGADSAAASGPSAAHEPSREAVITFSTFVLGMSTQALLHLGEIPDPTTQRLQRDLPAAKQVIDILGILQDKTRNNLEPGEQSLLDSVLYDLRMRYVELVRPGAKEST